MGKIFVLCMRAAEVGLILTFGQAELDERDSSTASSTLMVSLLEKLLFGKSLLEK
jgi:hypothetical protein